MDKKERKLNLKDMFLFVVQRWKLILIIILLSAVLSGIIGMIMSKQYSQKDSAEVAYGSLSAEDKADVENTAKIINNYNEMYLTQQKYNEDSIFQKLNPYGIRTLVLSYYVDNHFQISYPIIEDDNNILAIVQTYTMLLQEEALFEEMSKELDPSILPSYYQEIVSVETENPITGVIEITIFAHSDEMLDKIGDFIKGSIEKSEEIVDATYGEHDIVLTSEVRKETISIDVATQQQNNVNRLVEIKKQINNAQSSYTGEKLTYLKYLTTDQEINPVSIVKCVVIGAFVSAITTLIVLCFIYLLSSKIRTYSEIKNALDVTQIISIRKNVNKNKLLVDNHILKHRYSKNICEISSESVALASTKINALMENKKFESILFVDDTNIKDSAQFISDVSASVGEKYKTDIVELDFSNKDVISKILSCDALVAISCIESTKYSSLISLDNLCNEYGVEIIGTIVFE